MLSLEEKIVHDGLALGTQIVKVDSFLNHQIDVAFLHEIGQEFGRLFADKHPTKILTMESSGIGCAIAAAQALGDLPVLFAKKTVPSTMVEDIWYADVKSFTKGTVSRAVVARKFLTAGERVLIIDDFLAHGEAGMGMIEICRQAGAVVVGMGAVIEKEFQGGGARIREALGDGAELHSLAVISQIRDGVISFRH
ncbi:MAG: xanthine phosphoribosyltransferase [Firmicutes bacterium]|jgi:xanthine phosphoribosyltransferase|nr:xanthine phosphoribosyltransferase [Bacillota bacterium]MBR0179336.1 xanthine phosphoribosyltransferase [Bacillota bacterium]